MTFGRNHPMDEQVPSPVDEALGRMVAIASLGAIALIHVLRLPGAFDDAGYLGALFVAAVIASVVLAATLTVTGDPRAMQASGGLAAMLLLGYVLSRTTGLPAATDDIGDWDEPLGLVSMVFEGLLVVVAAGRLATAPRSAGRRVDVAAPRIGAAQPRQSAG